MSNMTSWPNHAVRRLNLGKGGSGGKMEYVFGAALAIIIIGAVVLAFTSGGEEQIEQIAGDREMYWCQQCQKEFEFDSSTLPPEQQGMYGKATGIVPPCPTCGGQNTVIEMVRCPECGEYYVSKLKQFERYQMYGQVQPGTPTPQDICPSCGTNRVQWYAEHLGD